jgi:glucose-6-phosphate dehydrogenase assembly protein OpcA
VGNTASSFNATVIEYADGERAAAQALAGVVQRDLGETPVQPMTSDVRATAGKAELAIVLGLDDAGFGGGG